MARKAIPLKDRPADRNEELRAYITKQGTSIRKTAAYVPNNGLGKDGAQGITEQALHNRLKHQLTIAEKRDIKRAAKAAAAADRAEREAFEAFKAQRDDNT